MKAIFITILLFCPTLLIAEEVDLKITETTEPDGRIRYDLHFNGGFHSFWSLEELENFGTTQERGCEFDCSDDESMKNRRRVMKSYVETNGINKTISDLKTKKKTFTILKSETVIQEKPSV